MKLKLITSETMIAINRWSKSGKSAALIRCPMDLTLSVMYSCEKHFENVYKMLEYIIKGEVKEWKKRIHF